MYGRGGGVDVVQGEGGPGVLVAEVVEDFEGEREER